MRVSTLCRVQMGHGGRWCRKPTLTKRNRRESGNMDGRPRRTLSIQPFETRRLLAAPPSISGNSDWSDVVSSTPAVIAEPAISEELDTVGVGRANISRLDPVIVDAIIPQAVRTSVKPGLAIRDRPPQVLPTPDDSGPPWLNLIPSRLRPSDSADQPIEAIGSTGGNLSERGRVSAQDALVELSNLADDPFIIEQFRSIGEAVDINDHLVIRDQIASSEEIFNLVDDADLGHRLAETIQDALERVVHAIPLRLERQAAQSRSIAERFDLPDIEVLNRLQERVSDYRATSERRSLSQVDVERDAGSRSIIVRWSPGFAIDIETRINGHMAMSVPTDPSWSAYRFRDPLHFLMDQDAWERTDGNPPRASGVVAAEHRRSPTTQVNAGDLEIESSAELRIGDHDLRQNERRQVAFGDPMGAIATLSLLDALCTSTEFLGEHEVLRPSGGRSAMAGLFFLVAGVCIYQKRLTHRVKGAQADAYAGTIVLAMDHRQPWCQ